MAAVQYENEGISLEESVTGDAQASLFQSAPSQDELEQKTSKEFVANLLEWGMPDAAWKDNVNQAFARLTNILKPTSPSLKLTIVPYNGLRLGLGCRHDQLTCLAFGSMRADLFIEMAWDSIRDLDDDISFLDIFDVNVDILVVRFRGVEFRIKYHRWHELAQRYPNIVDAPEDFLDSTGPSENAINDAIFYCKLMEVTLDMKNNGSLHTLYYTIRALAVNSGLWDGSSFKDDSELLEIILKNQHLATNKLTEIKTILIGLQVDSAKSRNHSGPRIQEILRRIDCDKSELSNLNSPAAEQWILEKVLELSIAQRFERKAYVVIQNNYFGQSIYGKPEMIKLVEKPLGRLIKDFEINTALTPTLWPSRLTSTKHFNPSEASYDGVRLIGLEKKTQSAEGQTQDPAEAITKFNQQTKALLSKQSKPEIYVHAELLPLANIPPLYIDTHPLPKKPLKDPNPNPLTTPIPKGVASTSVGVALRPANEILKKIKHDGSFRSSDYEVGFGDRGMTNWKGVDDWTTETTDDEFVPEGRIWLIRRISDGVVVWDRHHRLNLI